MSEAMKRPESKAIWRLLDWSLRGPSPVLMFDVKGVLTGHFSCAEGVAQGDVLAPWAFANSMDGGGWWWQRCKQHCARRCSVR